ncbi:MAG: ATP-binding protein [Cypionkella sp.]|jgi:serine/threonine-protein kinase RsbW|nr:ATP-binding protein [Cypionkella sp.]
MPGETANEGVCLRFAATPASVRAALMRLFDPPSALPLAADHAATAQLVLAEVLNNIVEHAYTCDGGDIALTCRLTGGDLAVRVVDRGCPLPKGAAEPPGPAALAGGLSEGGYGWFLIRSLTRDLTYHRRAGRNVLTFYVNP